MLPGSATEEDLISLCVQFRGLTVTVQGRVAPALEFVRDFAGEAAPASASPIDNHGTPQSTALTSAESLGFETRDSIARSFGACPAELLRSGSRLTGSSTLSGEERIKRAYLAGQWAGATSEGRVASPNSTPALDLGNRFYCVLRARGEICERLFTSSREYFNFVGDLPGSNSISHAFPSESEARAYFAGASRPYPA